MKQVEGLPATSETASCHPCILRVVRKYLPTDPSSASVNPSGIPSPRRSRVCSRSHLNRCLSNRSRLHLPQSLSTCFTKERNPQSSGHLVSSRTQNQSPARSLLPSRFRSKIPKEPNHKPNPRNDRTVPSLDQLFTTGEFITIVSTRKL